MRYLNLYEDFEWDFDFDEEDENDVFIGNEDFRVFLEDEGVLDDFIKHMNSEYNGFHLGWHSMETIKEYLKLQLKDDFIQSSFDWADANRKSTKTVFWGNLGEKWRKLIKKRKNRK